MKIKLPKFFSVFGVKVKVLIMALPDNISGTYHPYREVITLSDTHDSPKEMMHTLIHELGHCMFYRVSINQAVSKEVHEYIVNNMATMMLENFDITPKLKK